MSSAEFLLLALMITAGLLTASGWINTIRAQREHSAAVRKHKKAHAMLVMAGELANATYDWVEHVQGCTYCATGFEMGVHCEKGVQKYDKTRSSLQRLAEDGHVGIVEVRVGPGDA